MAVALSQPRLVLLALGAALLWLGLTTRWTPRRVLLRDEGLEVHRFFRKPLLFRFEDCQSVFREWSLHTTIAGTGVTDYALKLIDSRNQQLRLNPKSIEDAELLFTRIERLIVYPRQNELRAAFDTGADVSFGKGLLVNQEGIRISGKLTPWADVREVELSPRLLIFRFHGRFRRVFGVRRIPFPWALIGILREQGIRRRFFDGFKAA